MRRWITHQPREVKKGTKVDYVKFNKSLGAVKHLKQDKTASSMKEEAPQPTAAPAKSSHPNTNVSYGRPTRPSTPIKHVIGNQYAIDYEINAAKKQEQALKTQESSAKKKIISTKAAQGHKLGAQRRHEIAMGAGDERSHGFKLSRFGKIEPTFRLPGTEGASPKSHAPAADQSDMSPGGAGDVSPDVSP